MKQVDVVSMFSLLSGWYLSLPFVSSYSTELVIALPFYFLKALYFMRARIPSSEHATPLQLSSFILFCSHLIAIVCDLILCCMECLLQYAWILEAALFCFLIPSFARFSFIERSTGPYFLRNLYPFQFACRTVA